jgi:hypothetical protein
MTTNNITHRLSLAESEDGNRCITFGFIILGFLRTNIRKKEKSSKLFDIFFTKSTKKTIFAPFLKK